MLLAAVPEFTTCRSHLSSGETETDKQTETQDARELKQTQARSSASSTNTAITHRLGLKPVHQAPNNSQKAEHKQHASHECNCKLQTSKYSM